MWWFITTTLLLFSGVIANVSERQSTPSCCFQLASVGEINAVVGEDSNGDLLLSGLFEEARFCLDSTRRTLWDVSGDNCFIQAPNQQFSCYTGRSGETSFAITEPDMHGTSYLTYDDGIGFFHACPARAPNNANYYVYADHKTDPTGCFEITISVKNQTAECHAGNANVTPVPASVSTMSIRTLIPPTTRLISTEEAPLSTRTLIPPTTRPKRAEESSETTATSTLEIQTSPPTCTVPPSSPSVAPSRVGFTDPEAPGGIHDSSSEVSISPTNSTIFEYSIPPSFLPLNSSVGGEPPLCALQFRMPVCTELPEGYPCYDFSGLEQEFLSNSGITFSLTIDDSVVTWDDTALHQVFPGENSVIGTFECSRLARTYGGAHKISWQATSVRNFSLEFLHAGVGDNPEFLDGIGAWIVPCL